MASGKTIEGILMPMPVAFKHDGAIDHAGTDAILDFYLDTGVHGFFPLGTHGQGMTMEIEERKKIASLRRVERVRSTQICTAGIRLSGFGFCIVPIECVYSLLFQPAVSCGFSSMVVPCQRLAVLCSLGVTR